MIHKLNEIMNDAEINDVDLEEIARQIKAGYIEGRLDDGEGKHIYYKITMEVWKD